MTKNETRPAASAADILSPGPDTPKIEPRFRKYFDCLNKIREEIAQQRGEQWANGHTGEPTFGVNPADRGTDEYDTGSALTQMSSEQEAIYEIDQALQRIRAGTYGVCEATGKPIPEDRLEAIPWTRFARDVEEQLEREQQARKPRHVL